MPYPSKKHIQWIGLVELVGLVKAESECSVEAARDQIREALTDGAIWPLGWDPEPAPSEYCRSIFARQALAHGKPIYPPPPSPETRHDFKDSRDVSHWRDVDINWEQGLILDDFERQIYQKLGGDLFPVMGWYPEGYPKPRSPEWRTLWLDRGACERIWYQREIANKPTHAIKQEGACKAWLVGLMQNVSSPVKPKGEYRDEAFELYGISQRGFQRVWGAAIAETGNEKWRKPGPKSGRRPHEKS